MLDSYTSQQHNLMVEWTRLLAEHMSTGCHIELEISEWTRVGLDPLAAEVFVEQTINKLNRNLDANK